MSEQHSFDLMVLPDSALKYPRRSKKHGYAAPPGTGPAGETCKSCKHLTRKIMSGTFLKCGLMRAYWTGGYGTDVLSRAAACRRWEAKAE